MYKFKINLLYNGETFCRTKTELLNLKIILPCLKLDINGARLESNDLIFSGDISVDIQLVTFLLSMILLLFNVSESRIDKKTKKV